MNKIENLLFCVGEECGEIQQAISKVARFGPKNHKPCKRETKHIETNAEQVLIEFYQLDALIEMLQDEGILPKLYKSEVEEIKRQKKEKIEYFSKKSILFGTIKEE